MRLENVYREVCYQNLEKEKKRFTQRELAKTCKLAISTVNYALSPLAEIGAISKRGRGFDVIDIKKILLYWANKRKPSRDVIYKTFFQDLREAEKSMPTDAIFTAYTAYKLRFNSVPADYSEVYVYAADPKEIEKRFPPSKKKPNIFILRLDPDIRKTSKKNSVCLGQIFVDLWNLREWYASEFIKEFERKVEL